MGYAVIRSCRGGPDLVVEAPDPELMTDAARERFRHLVQQVNTSILERRGGVPLTVEELDEVMDEVRSERGTRSA